MIHRDNKDMMKTILCCIAIIKNENKETIMRIFEHLINKYNFKHNLLTMDFGRGPYQSTKIKFLIVGYIHVFFI